MASGQDVDTSVLENFVCRLYGIKNAKSVDAARTIELEAMAICPKQRKSIMNYTRDYYTNNNNFKKITVHFSLHVPKF